MMAYGRPPGKSAQERFAFEVAWEVCNKGQFAYHIASFHNIKILAISQVYMTASNIIIITLFHNHTPAIPLNILHNIVYPSPNQNKHPPILPETVALWVTTLPHFDNLREIV